MAHVVLDLISLASNFFFIEHINLQFSNLSNHCSHFSLGTSQKALKSLVKDFNQKENKGLPQGFENNMGYIEPKEGKFYDSKVQSNDILMM